MSVGEDVKDVYAEVGVKVNLIRPSGEAEYIDYEPNSQVTKPFIQEFFLEAYLPYDTNQVVGSIVNMDAFDIDYMVMGKTNTPFENEAYEIQSVYYKCNVSGELFRFSGEVRDPLTYEYQEVLNLVTGEVYALMTEPLFGTDVEIEDQLGVMGIERNELYIASSYGVTELDRYQPASGEYYLVKKVLERRFSGVDVCELIEDNR